MLYRDRFRAKSWIYWARLLICALLGGFLFLFGIAAWLGWTRDSSGEPMTEAGPLLTGVGVCVIVVGLLALAKIVGSLAPAIRCYADGIECNLVGATSLDGVRMLPHFIRLAWEVLSLQGFRTRRVRVRWDEFLGAEVRGLPMAYVLALHGSFVNLGTGATYPSVAFQQHLLKDSPHDVARAINLFASRPNKRTELPQWPGPNEMQGAAGAEGVAGGDIT